ncbi:MAG: NAD(+) synthase [Pseudomonadales bacterium]|jgi:NAD+ synthase (glutamine-hydrolysing)|nr:NAD(+) synthase [Pseudomonadales bacterium]
MTTALDFHNPYRHGFARVAVAVPRLRVADPAFNAVETVRLYREAAAQGAVLVVFPELGLSASTCGDLFHQAALLDACEAALQTVVEASRELNAVAVVGLPLRVDHRLFNGAAAVAGGRVLAVFPKTYPPDDGGSRFSAADAAPAAEIELCGQRAPFGADLLVQARQLPLLTFHCEIGEDAEVAIPPSSLAALAGATVLVNLAASNATAGRSADRHRSAGGHSARCLAACLQSSATGESTTNLAWDGEALIHESGELLAASERFSDRSQMVLADVDLERLSNERMRRDSFGAAARHRGALQGWRTVVFDLREIPPAAGLLRTVERFPYVPSDAARRGERCREVLDIQAQALAQRIEAAGVGKLVIGVSGGLDSTLALLVCAKAADRLGIARSEILGFTMPGFATGERTLSQAHALMRAIGCTAHEIDIRPSCTQMLRDLGHPFADGVPRYDITFENVQAGERASHLFRLANHHGGIVVGTGDLSELALGWCTYGVGDHMSHYNVNAGVPKTLIRCLVRWAADKEDIGAEGRRVLRAIADTEVSPELVPATGSQTQPGQRSEDTIGPYELQDFHLYYTLRHGFRPAKVAYLAWQAWHDRSLGAWPDDGQGERNEYGLAEIKRHLGTFLYRFFKTSQFKRSCAPDGPQAIPGPSLSPRGGWRAPSDSQATVWMADLESIPAGLNEDGCR